WMDSSAVQKLEAGTFKYINASVESNVVIENETDLFIDFALMDFTDDIDSVVVNRDSKRIKVAKLRPFMLRKVDASEEVGIVLYKDGNALPFKSNGKEKLSLKIQRNEKPLIVKDEIVFGLLALVLAIIF